MITSKQRAALKAMANDMPVLFQVGKGGVNDAFIKQADDALTARELIKLSCLETSPESAKDVAFKVAEATSSEVVQVIGRKMIFFRRNEQEPKINLK